MHRVLAAPTIFNSLPLMGIVNACRKAKAVISCCWTSLPLMGIVNAGNLPHGELARHLITPHGDRKRGIVCASVGFPPAAASLPLMGIVNSTSPASFCFGCSISLPLMGIVNCSFTHLRHLELLGLITPHGDRKHKELPKWQKDFFWISLPLMGIVNANRS